MAKDKDFLEKIQILNIFDQEYVIKNCIIFFLVVLEYVLV